MVSRSFIKGFCWGGLSALVGGTLLLYILSMLDLVGFALIQVPQFQQMLAWAYRNLGLSIVPFLAVLGLFCWSLRRLRQAIVKRRPLAEVSQLDHLCDIWTGLFFGIGVIWTAIGMRSALVYALGEPAMTATGGALPLLQRLVEGGILIALSTTIFGGLGGYLMRVVKACTLGNALRRYYSEAASAPSDAVVQKLSAIEQHLAVISDATTLGAGDSSVAGLSEADFPEANLSGNSSDERPTLVRP